MSLMEFLLAAQNETIPLNQWELDCLSLNGSNKILCPFQSIPGNANSPGISFQGNERTGLFIGDNSDENSLSVSIFGVESFRFSYGDLSVYSNGYRCHLKAPGVLSETTITLPNTTGTLALTSDSTGPLKYTGNTGTPTNTTTPTLWLECTYNGNTYYTPLYQ